MAASACASTSSSVCASSSSSTGRSPPPLTGAARKVFEFVKDSFSGSRYSISAWLTEAEHTLLEDTIFEDHLLGDLYTKACSIWLPPSHAKTRGWLVMSMPPRVHDEFCHLIKDALVNRIASFRQDANHPAYEASSKVIGKGKTNVKLGADGHCRPDIVFEYESAEMAYTTFPLVIEVGHSQTPKELARRVKLTLRNTDIKNFITFCLPYQDPSPKRNQDAPVNQEATYIIRHVEDDGNGEVQCTKVEGTIRDEHGVTQPGHLQLDLNDFLPDGYLLAPSSGTAITVSHETLAGFLASAFQLQAKSTVGKPELSEKRLNGSWLSDDESDPVPSAGSDNSPPQNRKSDKDYTAPMTHDRAAVSFSMTTRRAAREVTVNDDE